MRQERTVVGLFELGGRFSKTVRRKIMNLDAHFELPVCVDAAAVPADGIGAVSEEQYFFHEDIRMVLSGWSRVF